MDDDGASFFVQHGWVGPAEVASPPDAEARYEEGIPLVRSEPQQGSPTHPSEPFATTTNEDQAHNYLDNQLDFSRETGDLNTDRGDPFPSRQPLERKTTEEVLESLHYSPHHEAKGPAKVLDWGSEAPELPGDGMNISSDTTNGVFEVDPEENQRDFDGQSQKDGGSKQILPDDGIEQNLLDGYYQEALPTKESGENPSNVGAEEAGSQDIAEHGPSEDNTVDNDLAALWKAALDDDDLLIDGETSVDHSFFEDDREGFMGEGSTTVPAQIQSQGLEQYSPLLANDHNEQVRGNSSMNTAGTGIGVPLQTARNRYTPEASSTRNISSASSGQSGHTWQQPPYAVPASTVAQQARPGLAEKTQSFADQSKGGYTSPYDLPLDISRFKRRANLQHSLQSYNGHETLHAPPVPAIPPPRSSSMFASQPSQLSQTRLQPLPPNDLAESLLPQQSSASMHPPITSYGSSNVKSTNNSLKPKSSTGSFFEELPMTAKPRPQSGLGRNTPQHGRPSSPSSSHGSLSMQRQLSYSPPSQSLQLQAPERVSPYAIPPQAALTTPRVPSVASRYSPAPPPQSHIPHGQNRYATPPVSGPPNSHVLPFQPRTSSPLAHHEKSYHQQPQISGASARIELGSAIVEEPANLTSQTLTHEASEFGGLREENGRLGEEGVGSTQPSNRAPLSSLTESTGTPLLYQRTTNGPPPNAFPVSGPFPPKRAITDYVPQPRPRSPDKEPAPAPPRRSQTQSPGTLLSGPRLPKITQEPYQRPASVHEPTSAAQAMPSHPTLPTQQLDHRRKISQNANFISPTDGRERDPLQRWKGCPVFVFGFGGTILSSFPKHIPRYSAGQLNPMLKCSPGEVQLRHTKDVIPLEDHIVKFPGPLRSKGKKKDLLNWLDSRIAELEKGVSFNSTEPSLQDPLKRLEEKLILWKVSRVLVEHDGLLEGNQNVERAVRSILSPETATGKDDANVEQSYDQPSNLVGISRSSGSTVPSDPVNPEAIEFLRKLLAEGDREKAVWHAVDKRLWAHAMLISSTLSKDIWRQVVQEFVRQEVKLIGNNTESLAALYEIFAGNWEESIDELVPPSARAGLQMVSKVAGSGPTRNALDGLDRWRETLALTLSNRSVGDAQAILALGRLLSGYGRVEAAHTCYLFARSIMVFGGSDDPQANVTLFGAGQVQQSSIDSADLDAILLSEIYEYAVSVLPSSNSTVVPHLQGYKLYHAMKLAECGYRAEAQQYCDAIAGALKMTTKLAPYYHSLLFSTLDDLTKRLQQSPKDGSSSWISKPSMEKVSGSVWAKFNSFVAGDEGDNHSTGSGKGGDSEVGPFSKVAGGTPTISRTPSNTDLYGSYPGGPSGQSPLSTSVSSRYAPAGPYAPRTSLDQPGRSSHDSQRHSPYEPSRDPYTANAASGDDYALRNQPSDYEQYSQPPPNFSSNVAASHNPYAPAHSSIQPSSSPHYQGAYHPTPPPNPAASFEGYNPSKEAPGPAQSSQYQSSIYTPSGSNPAPSFEHGLQNQSAYEPPSYDPGYPNGEPSPVQERPRKAFTMNEDDEDDSFSKKSAGLIKEEKARKDKEADEAFKKAAAEDGMLRADSQKMVNRHADHLAAKKDAQPGDKKGWFGGWFGKKDPNLAPGPIKAKLGEESSFYYDPELKKWVNKKGGASSSAPSATPPPPRGPPSRAVSGPATAPNPTPPTTKPQASNLPPSIPPTASTPTPSITAFPASGPLSSVATPPRADSPLDSGNMLVPPSLAALASGAGSGALSGPPSRPTTSMSNASSIDDLIGAPAARKGGTVKKTKKGRGYVDVMAK